MFYDDKPRVAIIGGGIGGLTLAAALRHIADKEKLDVHLYEASPVLTEIGAGINFWPRSWRIMKEIGVQSRLAELLPTPPKEEMQTIFDARKADQLEGVFVDNIKMKGGAARFHRAELLAALHEKAVCQIHLSHRFESYEEIGNEVVIHFTNGTSATCDILIGVDGIHSTVRRCMLDKQGLFNSPSYDPYWSGSYVYRGLIDAEELEKAFPGHLSCKRPMMYFGKFRHIVTYQVSHKRMINVVAIISDYTREGHTINGPSTVRVSQEEVLSTFVGWEAHVQALFKCIKNPMRFALQAIRPLNSYSMGRVALLGDAAHGMLPHQGAGAGSAVEDSYILAALLASPLCTKSTIPDITKVYDAVRRPAANRVMELSRIAGRLCGINTPGYEDVTEGAIVEAERLQKLVNTISKNWEWSWNESAEDDKRRALEMLTFALQIPKQSTVPLVEKAHIFPPQSLRKLFFFLCGITASTAVLVYFVSSAAFIGVRDL